MSKIEIIKDLGDGLILRRATPADEEQLVAFNARIHSDEEAQRPDERVAEWTHDLFASSHPTFQVGDFTLVEDTTNGQIVSSLNLISQIWSYGGIPFKVGRPELVGTHPEYRHRGLVRAQFDIVHAWSAERGEMLQAITGIPYYYRLFGYEMALDLGGGRGGFKPQIPKLEENQEEPFHIRPAVEADLPFIAKLYDMGCQRSLISCVWNEALWRYELIGKSEKNVNRYVLQVITTLEGEPAGFLAHPPYRWGSMLAATAYELKAGISWAEVTPSVIRYLMNAGEAYQSESHDPSSAEAFGFWLGREHPVYQAITDRLPRVRKPYAWYLRVPDLAGFIRHIAPVLEERLAASPLVGHSGEFRLTFYQSGLRMIFERGKLNQVEAWQPAPRAFSGEAGFPGLTFLQLLFGYRSLSELDDAFADCWTESDTDRALLEILFPKQASNVWAIA